MSSWQSVYTCVISLFQVQSVGQTILETDGNCLCTIICYTIYYRIFNDHMWHFITFVKCLIQYTMRYCHDKWSAKTLGTKTSISIQCNWIIHGPNWHHYGWYIIDMAYETMPITAYGISPDGEIAYELPYLGRNFRCQKSIILLCYVFLVLDTII